MPVLKLLNAIVSLAREEYHKTAPHDAERCRISEPRDRLSRTDDTSSFPVGEPQHNLSVTSAEFNPSRNWVSESLLSNLSKERCNNGVQEPGITDLGITESGITESGITGGNRKRV